MDRIISTIKLYQTILDKSDKETAEEVMTNLKDFVQEEVQPEVKDQITQLREEMKEDFAKVRIEMKELQVQTIMWIVGVGILQVVAHYLLK